MRVINKPVCAANKPRSKPVRPPPPVSSLCAAQPPHTHTVSWVDLKAGLSSVSEAYFGSGDGSQDMGKLLKSALIKKFAFNFFFTA